MLTKVLLVTPPFTQLNTPYPATMYLKGFLQSKDVPVSQCDLSIELFRCIFTNRFIRNIFQEADKLKSYEYQLVWDQRAEYIDKVDLVISYLQNQKVTAAYQIINDSFLPKAHRFEKLEEDLNWAFGNLGVLDKAKHFATLFIEELGDFITANVDEFFSFTRYAEKIATSASSFDKLEEFLSFELTIIESKLIQLLANKLELNKPDLVCFSIPFPGNLFAALRCAQYIKKYYPTIKVAFGGGYCNTELRSITDTRIFDYLDFICLDDGESPLLKITQYLSKQIAQNELERTFVLKNKKVEYINKLPNTIFHHSKLPAPSY